MSVLLSFSYDFSIVLNFLWYVFIINPTFSLYFDYLLLHLRKYLVSFYIIISYDLNLFYCFSSSLTFFYSNNLYDLIFLGEIVARSTHSDDTLVHAPLTLMGRGRVVTGHLQATTTALVKVRKCCPPLDVSVRSPRT